MQAQLAEERERSTAREAGQREAREAARKQQTAARREAEHLRERLAAADAAAEVSARKASDLVAQVQVLLMLCLSLGLGILIVSSQATAFSLEMQGTSLMPCAQGACATSYARAISQGTGPKQAEQGVRKLQTARGAAYLDAMQASQCVYFWLATTQAVAMLESLSVTAPVQAAEARLKQAELGERELQAALEAAQQDAVEAATSAGRADKELGAQQSMSGAAPAPAQASH